MLSLKLFFTNFKIGLLIIFGLGVCRHFVGIMSENFSLYELTEIMRQKGEYEFCKALNNMAEGQMDEDDIKLIKSREISDQLIPPDGATYLFETNKECETHNATIHEGLGTLGAESIAFDRIQGSGSENMKRTLLEQAKMLTIQQTSGLRYKTHLQVGGEYFVSTIIDVQDGLFNGSKLTANNPKICHLSKNSLSHTPKTYAKTGIIEIPFPVCSTGILKHIEFGVTADNTQIPQVAWMEFDHPLVGSHRRATWRSYQKRKNIPLNWVAIERITRNLSKAGQRGLQIIRTQIPLVASNATTIYKSQGSSKRWVVLCTQTKLSRAKLYVGCSRATSINGLYINGIFTEPARPPHDDEVSVEMERLRGIPFQFRIKCLQDFPTTHVKLYYHNVQSLLLHYPDVTCDQCVLASDYMLLLEPHLLHFDEVNINNFNVVFRENCRTTRNSEGAIVFARSTSFIEAHSIKSCTEHSHFIIVRMVIECKNVILAYKHPRYPNPIFMDRLREAIELCSGEILVLGDFNIDLKQSNALLSFFASINLEPKLDITESTTDGGTHLDCCFSNIANLDARTYESYYSYHKPICVTWPRA